MFPLAQEFVNIRIVFPRIQWDEDKFGNKFCDSQQYHEAAMNNLTRNTDFMQKATSQNSFFEFDLLKSIDQPISVTLVKVDTILCTLTFVAIMLTRTFGIQNLVTTMLR